jgi:hypothetical protein
LLRRSGKRRISRMSTTEILEELPRLAREEREKIWERLEEIELEEMEATPEVLAAIEEGIRSAETEPGWTVEQVRGKVASWVTKSS